MRPSRVSRLRRLSWLTLWLLLLAQPAGWLHVLGHHTGSAGAAAHAQAAHAAAAATDALHAGSDAATGVADSDGHCLECRLLAAMGLGLLPAAGRLQAATDPVAPAPGTPLRPAVADGRLPLARGPPVRLA
jgi:hypothetical protein